MDLAQHKKAQEQMRSIQEDIEHGKRTGAKEETNQILEDTLEIYKKLQNKT